jgi:hypothetical protein
MTATPDPIHDEPLPPDRRAGRLVALATVEAGLRNDSVNLLIGGATQEELQYALALLSGVTAGLLLERYGDDRDLSLRHIELLRQYCFDLERRHDEGTRPA